MKYIKQISWWLHATWMVPLMGLVLAVIAHMSLGISLNTVIIGYWSTFAVVCVIWWFWIMGAVRHIIETYERVEINLVRVSDQLTDIKRELGSIREHNY